jgi:hypothetical protein
MRFNVGRVLVLNDPRSEHDSPSGSMRKQTCGGGGCISLLVEWFFSMTPLPRLVLVGPLPDRLVHERALHRGVVAQVDFESTT